jgi:hypothetical protein
MGLTEKEKAKVIEHLKLLEMLGAIICDGDWIERFAERFMDEDPEVAGEAAFDAIQDNQVMTPAQVAVLMCTTLGINRAAAATALKTVWLDQGIGLPPSELRAVFQSVASVPRYLMDSKGQETLAGLNSEVTIYRGQLFDAGKKSTGASWTLSEEVAQWYSAPARALGSSDRGWVLAATVSKAAILAVFCESEEMEVVLDLSKLNRRRLTVNRGTCDEFPAHLSKSSLGIVGLLSSFIGGRM